MTGFSKREKAFEGKHIHDKDLAFKILARSSHLLGLWAAEKLNLTGEAAEEYAQALIVLNIKSGNPERVIEQILTDFKNARVKISDYKIRKQASYFYEDAAEQILKG